MFPDTILQMNNGATVMELSDALEKVVAAVRAAGKSGSITLTVNVRPASKGSNNVLMVESQAKMLSEEVMLGAVMFGHEQMQTAIREIASLAKEAGRPPITWNQVATDEALVKAVERFAPQLTEAYGIAEKQTRYAKIGEIKKQCVAEDVGQHLEAVVLLDQAHRNAGDGPLDRHAGVHQRQARAADARHRARSVRLGDLGDHPDDVRIGLHVRHHGLDAAPRQPAMADFTPLR